jgi:tRNA pseudouridine55 synthase
MTDRPLSGVLNIHKPSGMTSRDVVDVVKRLVRPARTGHAGTLDPLATGVLVVCVGSATRLIEYVQRQAKRYRATFLLGRSSPTEDVEGDVTMLADAPRPSINDVRAAAVRFTGEIMQRPPIFSALKVAGRRSYALARAGQEVALAPRPIMIHAIEVIEYVYPELTLDIRCGSGTYVRSLGRDLAEAVGTAAVMSALVRTEIGEFHLTEACPCNGLQCESLVQFLRPPLEAIRNLPLAELTENQAVQVAQGRFVALPDVAPQTDGEWAAVSPTGELVAILVPRGQGLFGARLNLSGSG